MSEGIDTSNSFGLPTDSNSGSSPDSLQTGTSPQDLRISGSGAEETMSEKSSNLSLTDDYYGPPDDDIANLRSVDELEEAIAKCKDHVLNSEEGSPERRRLVKHLIELRIKLQDVKDTSTMPLSSFKFVQEHRFVPFRQLSPKSHCDKCSGIIWAVLNVSYQCTECNFLCHIQCLNEVSRKCTKVCANEANSFVMDICPEKGLTTQRFKCYECKSHITFKNSVVEPRLCDYDGHFYCPRCHWNNRAVIPARVLHNWDFEERRVCQASKHFLTLMAQKPILKLEDVNKMLYTLVDELPLVKRLREDILVMKKYFAVCQLAYESKLLHMLAERQHFVETSNIFSLQDLIDINSGVLLKFLGRVHAAFVSHIKNECEKCYNQGYICELCENKKIIFPFDDQVTTCSDCSTVFHSMCRARLPNCPKCDRKQRRAKISEAI